MRLPGADRDGRRNVGAYSVGYIGNQLAVLGPPRGMQEFTRVILEPVEIKLQANGSNWEPNHRLARRVDGCWTSQQGAAGT